MHQRYARRERTVPLYTLTLTIYQQPLEGVTVRNARRGQQAARRGAVSALAIGVHTCAGAKNADIRGFPRAEEETRPPIGSAAASVVESVRLDPELQQALAKRAERDHETTSCPPRRRSVSSTS